MSNNMPRMRDILIAGGLTSAVVIGTMALLQPKERGLVELVCNDGKDITIPLTGWDTKISATAFGNGVLWSIPTDSGIALVHWQDQYSACVVRNG